MKPRTVTHASFTLERHFRQSPARVFHAFADTGAKEAWFHGPDDWGRDVHELDFRVGGRETSVGGPPPAARSRASAPSTRTSFQISASSFPTTWTSTATASRSP